MVTKLNSQSCTIHCHIDIQRYKIIKTVLDNRKRGLCILRQIRGLSYVNEFNYQTDKGSKARDNTNTLCNVWDELNNCHSNRIRLTSGCHDTRVTDSRRHVQSCKYSNQQPYPLYHQHTTMWARWLYQTIKQCYSQCLALKVTNSLSNVYIQYCY